MPKSKESKVGTTMNTENIIKAVAEKSKTGDTQLSQTQVHTALNLLKEVVGEALTEGQKVQLTGFVTFTPSYRGPRKGNNIVTGESLDIPECIVVSAKAGKGLKDVLKDLPESTIKAIKG